MTRNKPGAGGEGSLLPEWDDRLPWKDDIGPITVSEILQGSPETGLVIVSGSAFAQPTKIEMQAVWAKRAKQTVDPVLVSIEYDIAGSARIAILGPDRVAVPVLDIEKRLAERLLEDALLIESPTRLTQEVRRRLGTLLGGMGPGFRNEGLFASHVLSQQPQRPDWQSLCARSRPLLRNRAEPLLTALGYTLDPVPDGVVLREASGGHRRAAAVLLEENESLDNPLSRFHGSNAITHGLALARREGVPWLIVLGGSVARLFPANPDVGVGRKGQTQTYVEVDLGLLSDDTAGYLALLFSPDALVDGGTVATLLAESSKYATGLSERLRDRIYLDVIPVLAVAVADNMNAASLPAGQQRAALDEAYHQSMIILFRLLFVAYAEDRGLLPLDVNDTYTSNALKTLGRRILDAPDQTFADKSTSLWSDLTQIWDVIDTGDLEGMGVPAYNGGLFTREPDKNPSGAATYNLRLTNSQIGPVIRGLMIDTNADGNLGLVDFRSLDVREFGTIYEGLLESGLGIADVDLALDTTDTYVPADENDDVWISAGEPYFHSRSGSRKATGSYFTNPFAVQHLLDQALEPALDDHLTRVGALIAKGAHKSASEMLFDFRVADLSMGSAHFLVAAIDRIEARFSEFLSHNPLDEVTAQLHTLRTTAAAHLGIPAGESGIDDGVLLRRQIARRCIYGADINQIAVELARLAIWIHTFVPGLPLSFLNHGLIHGNSLTGVGTIQEIATALEEAQAREDKNAGTAMLFDLSDALSDFLDRAAVHLAELGALADASVADVAHAAKVQAEIAEALNPLTALCDLITAERTTRHRQAKDSEKIRLVKGTDIMTATDALSLERAILSHPFLDVSRKIALSIDALHMPVRFPEVFRREPGGFDVILGNPPWEKVKVEEHSWWSARFPGVQRGVSQDEKNRRISELRLQRPDMLSEFEDDVASAARTSGVLTSGAYPGIGATDIDLYAAFCWRFWQELRESGRAGLVLPRNSLSGAALATWRREVLVDGAFSDLTTLANNKHWVFESVHPQQTIVLMTLNKGGTFRGATLAGPYSSLSEFLQGRSDDKARVSLSGQQILMWSDSASIPSVPVSDLNVFMQMKSHPSLSANVGSWRFRPLRELDTTKEKRFLDFNLAKPAASHSLEVWTGGTFNLWDPSFGEPYAYASEEDVETFLQEKRLNQIGVKSSAFFGMDATWAQDVSTLPARGTRLVFRDVTKNDNSRTMLCALAPPRIALVHPAPFLFRAAGDQRDESFLLGVLSSLPFDCFTRRFVELHMTFELLNSFPVPRVDGSTGRVLSVSGDPVTGPWDLRPVRDRVIEISGRLAAVDARYAEWAKAVGVPVGSVRTSAEKDDLIAELDALVSLLYGLSDEQVGQVFASFHRGWDYQPRLDAVLVHYSAWQSRLNDVGRG